MLGKFKDFVFSYILGVKIGAKKVDMLGNLEVFVLGVGCWLREMKFKRCASVLSLIFMGKC